jgi:MoaA/NifB/PqqE/SkfB family radical SAM enzyme
MNSPKTKNNFCIRPFTSLEIFTRGSIKSCCRIRPEKTNFKGITNFTVKTGIKKFWKSEYRKYLKHKFLANERPKECIDCWQQEDRGSTSHRMRGNEDQRIIFQNKNTEKYLRQLGKWELDFPQDVTVSITNLCNLKCQMCDGVHSSTLLQENHKLGLEQNIRQKDLTWSDKDKINTIEELIHNKLKTLYLLGGEPLMVPEILFLLEKLSVDKIVTDNLQLNIVTNGTICNDKIINLLGKFKKVKLVLSIDSTGKCNEYIRFPSKWSTIESNVLKFKSLENVTLYINSVVQNINLLNLQDNINFAYEHGIHLNFSILDRPEYLQFDNLPKTLLQLALNRLSKIEDKKLIHTTNCKNFVDILSQKVSKEHVVDIDNYDKFKSIIQIRDAHRKISINDYIPELGKAIEKQ